MQKQDLIMDISEAQSQLEEIIDKLKNKDDYDVIEFEIDIRHAISHINTTYNMRNWSKEQISKDYNNLFDQLRQIPEDKYLIN